MKSWMEEKSFPIVTLRRLKGPEKDLILAKQESFLEHKSANVDNLNTKISGNKTAGKNNNTEKGKLPTRYM